MCRGCQEQSLRNIVELMKKHDYSLNEATAIWRDTVVQNGLMDRGAMGVETIEDVQALSDDVTTAYEVLREILERAT